MAAFIARQMMGNQLSAVTDIGGGDNMSAEEKERLAQLEQERLEALKEQEDQRRMKHQAIEEERERMRSGIRDKYNIRKKQSDPGEGLRTALNAGGLGDPLRPGEEFPGANEPTDEFTKLKNNIEQRFCELRASIESRCVIS